MPEDSMREDVSPIGDGPSFNELVKMEHDHPFHCLDCQQVSHADSTIWAEIQQRSSFLESHRRCTTMRILQLLNVP
jgi:hypothetical protein